MNATKPGSAFKARTEPPEVYAVFAPEPEVGAYAMAKYSRSALSMRESLREIDGQKAEKFLNTFYFQYGHRSIADLAHLSFALENLSIIAAIEAADETRWDGQERSTRYQEFRSSGFVIPAELPADEHAEYALHIQALFAEYEWFSARLLEFLSQRHARPEAMKPEVYQRTLRARAFDVGRYFLPLASCTSLGQIVSARTLEQQIARLLSSELAECQALGRALKRAATEPTAAFGREVRPAPTLVKYTDPSAYLIETRAALRQAAHELLAGIPVVSRAGADLVATPPLEIELAASLLYPQAHHSYRQICEAVSGVPVKQREEIIALGREHRGPHDELLREYQAGQAFQFDLLMDIGGFRDLHRHRRCVQLHQAYTTVHGFDTPTAVVDCGESERYQAAMRRADKWAARPATNGSPQSAAYGLPLGFRRRSLFKMDLAEVIYIAELRTTPAGHFSYREVAWQMFEALRQRHPALAEGLRVINPREWDNPLER